ncbi:MAG: nitric oxide reductase transcriptional regulator NorR [Thermoanaerobaculia bacterium]
MEIATLSSGSQPDALEVLLDLARDLTASLGALDRYERLLAAVGRILPFDAACLLRLQGDELVPLAAHGLVPSALERPYPRHAHPRLDAILKAPSPILFPHDSVLPDPFDGLLTVDPHALERIHACLGCRLTSSGEVVGALTADALDPHAFDGLDGRLLATLGALAGAALRTASLIEALEKKAERGTRVARELQRSADETSGATILGTSRSVAALLSEISIVAASDLPVLVTGETGVGKELVARHVHAGSRRREEALIHVNCAALPESVAESELFGHVTGAFTGAVRDRAGKFEVADGGSLFLDEVGELPLSIQPKLLRALQQGEIQRIGSDRLHRVDVRVIAATNRDLAGEVERGRFRADLYHRLAVYPIRVPSLRERREDIPLLATHFADAARRRLGLGPLRLSDEARARLAAADWPGNVRELENVVSRAVLRAAAGRPPGSPIVVGLAHVDVAAGGAPEPAPAAAAATEPVGPLREQVDEFQRCVIRGAIERNGGNVAAAARELGMHRANLHHLARRLGLKG